MVPKLFQFLLLLIYQNISTAPEIETLVYLGANFMLLTVFLHFQLKNALTYFIPLILSVILFHKLAAARPAFGLGYI